MHILPSKPGFTIVVAACGYADFAFHIEVVVNEHVPGCNRVRFPRGIGGKFIPNTGCPRKDIPPENCVVGIGEISVVVVVGGLSLGFIIQLDIRLLKPAIVIKQVFF